MLACERGCVDTVKILVEAGCDTGARNSHGRTGWELAKICGHEHVTRFLAEYARGEGPNKNKSSRHKVLFEELRQLKAKPMETQRQEDGEILAERLHVWHTVGQRPTFNNFTRIGGGAYGDIFKVDDVFPVLEVNKERVSTVVLKAVKSDAGEEAATALGNETRALSKLDNPYIVSVYGFARTAVPKTDDLKQKELSTPVVGGGAQKTAEHKQSKADPGAGETQDEKQYVLLLQLCDRGDLNKEIHESNSWRVKWRYALEMARGLAYIHAQGQAHLDIKPGNIFLRKRQSHDDEAHAVDVPYQVHVGDFGMDGSKSIDEERCEKMSVDQLRCTLDKWSWDTGGRGEWTRKLLDRTTVSEQPVPVRHDDDDSDLPACEKRHERRKEIDSMSSFENLMKHPIAKHLRGREKDQVDALVKKHVSASVAEKRQLTDELKAEQRQLTDELKATLLYSSEVKPKPVGTYDYMALEAYEGFPEPASDAFSYGVMLWELVTEKRVYEGFQPQDNEVWDGGITYDETSPYAVQAEQIPDRFYRKNRRPTMYEWVPEPMKRLIEACWTQNPDARLQFPTIVRVLELLEDQVDGWKTQQQFKKEIEEANAKTLQSEITYGQFLAQLGLVQGDLSDYLNYPGNELTELKAMEAADDLDSDILEDIEFTEEQKTKFRAAVTALPNALAEAGASADEGVPMHLEDVQEDADEGEKDGTAAARLDSAMQNMYGGKWLSSAKQRLIDQAHSTQDEVDRLHQLHQRYLPAGWATHYMYSTAEVSAQLGLHDDLAEAAELDHSELIRRLLAKMPRGSVDATVTTSDLKRTVLHVACAADSPRTVWFLLKHADPRANPTIKDKYGADAFDLAKAAGMSKRVLRELEIAVKTYGCLLGRYRLDPGRPHHVSFTCTVIFATDFGPLRENQPSRRIALKFMSNSDQFKCEIDMRLRDEPDESKTFYLNTLHARADAGHGCLNLDCNIEFGDRMLDSDKVVGMLLLHILPKDVTFEHIEACDVRLQGRHLLVMDLAVCDLMDAISHGHFAGTSKEMQKKDRKNKVIHAVKHIAGSLLYFEKEQRSHGDCKLRNLVQVSDGPGSEHKDLLAAKISLADFDASVRHGEPAGVKYSSGCLPPELLHRLCEYQDLQGKVPQLKVHKEAQTFELVEVQARLDQAYAQLESSFRKLQAEEAKLEPTKHEFEEQERLHLDELQAVLEHYVFMSLWQWFCKQPELEKSRDPSAVAKVSSWSVEDVTQWLTSRHLWSASVWPVKYVDAFTTAGVNGRALVQLDKDRLKELGVKGTNADRMLTSIDEELSAARPVAKLLSGRVIEMEEDPYVALKCNWLEVLESCIDSADKHFDHLSNVSVYSSSGDRWLDGSVTKVDKKSKIITVEYLNAVTNEQTTKSLEFGSRDIQLVDKHKLDAKEFTKTSTVSSATEVVQRCKIEDAVTGKEIYSVELGPKQAASLKVEVHDKPSQPTIISQSETWELAKHVKWRRYREPSKELAGAFKLLQIQDGTARVMQLEGVTTQWELADLSADGDDQGSWDAKYWSTLSHDGRLTVVAKTWKTGEDDSDDHRSLMVWELQVLDLNREAGCGESAVLLSQRSEQPLADAKVEIDWSPESRFVKIVTTHFSHEDEEEGELYQHRVDVFDCHEAAIHLALVEFASKDSYRPLKHTWYSLGGCARLAAWYKPHGESSILSGFEFEHEWKSTFKLEDDASTLDDMRTIHFVSGRLASCHGQYGKLGSVIFRDATTGKLLSFSPWDMSMVGQGLAKALTTGLKDYPKVSMREQFLSKSLELAYKEVLALSASIVPPGIDQTALREAVRYHDGRSIDDLAFSQIWKLADSNADGILSRDEFADLFESPTSSIHLLEHMNKHRNERHESRFARRNEPLLECNEAIETIASAKEDLATIEEELKETERQITIAEAEQGDLVLWEEWIRRPEHAVAANVSLDMWSFGVLLFRLCSNDAAPIVMIDEKDNIVERTDQEAVAYRWAELKDTKTKTMPPQWNDARDLVSWCLCENPAHRPDSFRHVLEHAFLHEGGKLHFKAKPGQPRERAIEHAAKALHLAIRDDDVDGVRQLLIDGGAHYNLCLQGDPSEGSTTIFPIHRAVRAGRQDMVEVILSETVPQAWPRVLNAQAEFGYTALHWCAHYGAQTQDSDGRYAAIADRLIPSADTSLVNFRGKTAWELARLAGSWTVEAVFNKHARKGSHKQLSDERKHYLARPDVTGDASHDTMALDHGRFTLWDIDEPCQSYEHKASGSFAKIYKLSDVSPFVEVNGKLYSEIALKVPRPEGVAELKDEIKSLYHLSHENVVQILGMTEGPAPGTDKAWQLAMEFCETDLRRLVYRKVETDPLGNSIAEYSRERWVDLMVDFTQQIATGLAYVHGKGMPHLDCKCDNILLAVDKTREGCEQSAGYVCKLADFGMVVGDGQRYRQSASKDTSSASRESTASSANSTPRGTAEHQSRTADRKADSANTTPSGTAERQSAHKEPRRGSVTFKDNPTHEIDPHHPSFKAAGHAAMAAMFSDLEKVVPYGTWEYMAPECYKRKYGEPCLASDIFSLGLMLWEMIARDRIYKTFTGFQNEKEAPSVYVSAKSDSNKLIRTKGMVDVKLIAARLALGERPKPPPKCPELLHKLMQACWAPHAQERPTAPLVLQAIQNIRNTELNPEGLKVTIQRKLQTALTYDDFVESLGLTDKKTMMTGLLSAPGKEMIKLMQMNDDDLEEDIIENRDLALDTESKEEFLKVVKAQRKAADILTYDEFLVSLDMTDKKTTLQEILAPGKEMVELDQMDVDDLEEDIIEDIDLALDDESKERFRKAVEAQREAVAAAEAEMENAPNMIDAADRPWAALTSQLELSVDHQGSVVQQLDKARAQLVAQDQIIAALRSKQNPVGESSQGLLSAKAAVASQDTSSVSTGLMSEPEPQPAD
eukprot:COSAG06_NODE_69_length_26016_cov_6.603272_21_plen_2919_part_00